MPLALINPQMGIHIWNPSKAITNIKGIRATGVLKTMRVNSFPVMAVDISGGANNGTFILFGQTLEHPESIPEPIKVFT